MGKRDIDDRYELRGRLGGGGMADVFLAHDEVLDREVALKLLKARFAGDEEFVERFRREAKHAAALSHPNIVSIYDRGEDESGTYYIAMEYLSGGTLDDRMGGALPVRTAAAVALQVADALQAAHERGVVHRDVKPRNVLVADTGDVKVGDFGIARAADATTISGQGAVMGTARYMAPEQAQGLPVGPRSDLYSLGVVLYEMLTGTVPFEVAEPADVPARHAEGPPRRPRELNPQVPDGMDALVMRLLATDPEDRPRSAARLVGELEWAQDALPPIARPAAGEGAASTGPEARTVLLEEPGGPGTPRRKWSWPLAIAAALVAALGVVGWNLWRDDGGIPAFLDGVLDRPADRAAELARSEVPEVEGLTEREARERLASAGFEADVRPRESAEGDAGRVLGQSVPGGERAEQGSTVTLAVGEGARRVEAPDLVGLSYPRAEEALREAGLLVGGVEQTTSESEPAGVIVAQDPPPGTRLETDAYVYLTTSVGPPEGGQYAP